MGGEEDTRKTSEKPQQSGRGGKWLLGPAGRGKYGASCQIMTQATSFRQKPSGQGTRSQKGEQILGADFC